MWFKNKFFKITTGIILILLIIVLSMQLLPVINFILNIIGTLFYPTIITIVLYYLLRPLRNFLEARGVHRLITIIFIYCMMVFLIIFAITFIWPSISKQVTEFSSTPKEKIEEIQNKTIDIMDFFNFTSIPKAQLEQTLTYYSKQLLKIFTDNFLSTISSIAKIASYFIVTPFILFYLLKDDQKLRKNLLAYAAKGYKKDLQKIATDIDATLSYFITGQVLVAAIVAILILIGYWIIGLNYIFILALFTFIFNMIPFTGPFISTIPALLLGLAQSPIMGVKVVAVVIIVHLLDLNIISPRIVGQQLNIHPVTIILLLLAALSLFGVVGLFLITPGYAILKIILFDLYEIKQEQDQEQ